jgi:hypothetical protein
LSKYIIKYESLQKDSILPSKNFIPEWYKSEKINSLKKCMPFLDAFLTGYIVSLPYDIEVICSNKNPEIKLLDGSIYNGSTRDAESISIIPFNHYSTEFAWDLCTALTIPTGASILFTHPLNRHDLPFTTLSGVIDGEFTLIPHGAIPFYVKQGFEGVIKAGTPVAQIIPFGNDSWKTEIEIGLFESSKKYRRSKAKDWYKKTSWKRKNYD